MFMVEWFAVEEVVFRAVQPFAATDDAELFVMCILSQRNCVIQPSGCEARATLGKSSQSFPTPMKTSAKAL